MTNVREICFRVYKRISLNLFPQRFRVGAVVKPHFISITFLPLEVNKNKTLTILVSLHLHIAIRYNVKKN